MPAVEDDPDVVSVGRGGCPDRSGQVSLDASIMVSPAQCGSVCYVRQFAHPITIARGVMEKLHLVLLAGDGADRFAMRQGMSPENLLTDRAKAMWQKWANENPSSRLGRHGPISAGSSRTAIRCGLKRGRRSAA